MMFMATIYTCMLQFGQYRYCQLVRPD